ncbi:MAG: tyrosine-type recombinase/integrase [Terriglobales bacterium]
MEKRGKRKPVWFARYRITEMTPDGTKTRRQVAKVIGTMAELPTKKMARDRLFQIVNEAEGTAPRVAATFGEFADRWERTILPLFKFSTRRSYASLLRLYLRPRFGSLPLAQVQAFEVQSLISELSREHAPESCKRVWDLLSGMFRKAMEWNWTRENPCRGVKLPRRFRKPQQAVDSETIARVHATLEEPYATLLLFIAATAFRRSEVFALRWQSIQWDLGLICASENIVDGQWGTPKGQLEPRVLPVPAWVLDRLRSLRDWYGGPEPERVIFASRAGSPLNPANVLNRHLKPACDRLGIPRFGFHALRRGVTTEQVASGTDVITMQGWLGHKDPATTLRHYAMADHRRMRAAVEARGEKLFTTVHQNALTLSNTKLQAPEK